MCVPMAAQELLLYYLKCIHALDFDAGILDAGVTKSKITKTCIYYVNEEQNDLHIFGLRDQIPLFF